MKDVKYYPLDSFINDIAVMNLVSVRFTDDCVKEIRANILNRVKANLTRKQFESYLEAAQVKNILPAEAGLWPAMLFPGKGARL